MTFSCYACKGLLIGEPIVELAAYLNAETPNGIHFNVVGGLDPQTEQDQITKDVEDDIAKGKEVIFIGHSKGAMLAYYLADSLKAKGLKASLFVAIDPTCWGSNVDHATPWLISLFNGGKWAAPDNIGKFIDFHQPSYPGGGVCISGGTDIAVSDVDHLSIVNSNIVRMTILAAIKSFLA